MCRTSSLSNPLLLAVLLPVAAIACGGSSSSSNGTGDAAVVPDTPATTDAPIATDAAPETSTGDAVADVANDAVADVTTDGGCPAPTGDNGALSTTYPAFATDIAAMTPKLANSGGPELVNPVITAITWPGTATGTDPDSATVETFVGKIAGSNYWTDTTAEYGIGVATATAPVHLDPTTDAVPTTDTEAVTFIQAHVGVSGSTFPAPSSNSVFVLFLPPGANFSLDGEDACTNGIGGYHDNTVLADGVTTTAYAVVMRCAEPAGSGITALQFATLASSHEIAEAATDAFPSTNPAYLNFRTQDYAWSSFQRSGGGGTEIGDNCELYEDFAFESTELGGVAQRLWSNNSFAAGHSPCVPVLSSAYFNAVPLATSTVSITAHGGTVSTPGYMAPLGGCGITIQAGFYSDAATTAPWSFAVYNGGGMPPETGAPAVAENLTFTSDKTTGQNGEKVNINVVVTTAGKRGYNLMTLVSYTPSTINPLDYTTWTDDTLIHYFPVLIVTPAATTTTDAGASTDAPSGG